MQNVRPAVIAGLQHDRADRRNKNTAEKSADLRTEGADDDVASTPKPPPCTSMPASQPAIKPTGISQMKSITFSLMIQMRRTGN